MLPEYTKILYATDLSESARLALRHAESLAVNYGASMTILHVVPDLMDLMSEDAGFDIGTHFEASNWKELNASATARANKKALKRVREMAAECATEDARCPVATAEVLIETGDPAERILTQIRNQKYDLVVMGAHGRGVFSDMLLGSVARKIVRLSPVPVLTVRLPEEKA